jgi:hypothetical protein
MKLLHNSVVLRAGASQPERESTFDEPQNQRGLERIHDQKLAPCRLMANLMQLV